MLMRFCVSVLDMAEAGISNGGGVSRAAETVVVLLAVDDVNAAEADNVGEDDVVSSVALDEILLAVFETVVVVIVVVVVGVVVNVIGVDWLLLLEVLLIALVMVDCVTVEATVDATACTGPIRSMPGTRAAGTGGGAGNGDVGSRVGSKGARSSGSRLYRFSFGEIIFISRNFWRRVSTHSCIMSQVAALKRTTSAGSVTANSYSCSLGTSAWDTCNACCSGTVHSG